MLKALFSLGMVACMDAFAPRRQLSRTHGENGTRAASRAGMLRHVAGLLAGAVLLLISPTLAHALQSHAEPEGIVVHQLAHLAFLVAMVAMVLRIRLSSLHTRRSWRFFSRGAGLLACWNLWAFVGHQAELLVSRTSFQTVAGQTPLLQVDSWVTLLYYFSKMDHFLLVPAMAMFYMGMRQLIAEDRR